MNNHRRKDILNRPGALIAALPALLGFVPEKSLIVVSVEDQSLGAVLRADLSADLIDRVDHLAELAATANPEAAIAVIVDAGVAACVECGADYRALCSALDQALTEHGIVLSAAYVVDRVAVDGRWHCVDGCGSDGIVDDPAASPLAAAAVFNGRRLYSRREDLRAVIAAENGSRRGALTRLIDQESRTRRRACGDVAARQCRDVERVVAAVVHLASGHRPPESDAVEFACALRDPQVRDSLYGLAVCDLAAAAESLWALLARLLPSPWRVEALALLAFSAYVRGDGPLAGIALEEALRSDPAHRMSGMLDTALQSGLRPDDIRELAFTGYRTARRIGAELPPQTAVRLFRP